MGQITTNGTSVRHVRSGHSDQKVPALTLLSTPPRVFSTSTKLRTLLSADSSGPPRKVQCAKKTSVVSDSTFTTSLSTPMPFTEVVARSSHSASSTTGQPCQVTHTTSTLRSVSSFSASGNESSSTQSRSHSTTGTTNCKCLKIHSGPNKLRFPS